MDATTRVDDMIVILERFAEVLEQENAALKAHRSAEVQSLLEDKSALSRVYESRARSLMGHPEDLAKVEPKLRHRLKELNRKADGLVAENATLLKVSIEAQKRVVEVIRDAVKDAQPGAKTYSPQSLKSSPRRRTPSPPMAIDQSL